MAGQETLDRVFFLFQEHLAKVAVAKTYFTLGRQQNRGYRKPEDLRR